MPRPAGAAGAATPRRRLAPPSPPVLVQWALPGSRMRYNAMKTSFRPVCCLVLATSGLLVGQQSSLQGPVAGFVFDNAARVLRPIQGVPGASLLGDPVNFGFALSTAYVSPG